MDFKKGYALNVIMYRKGLNVKQVAHGVGTSTEVVRRWINGTTMPSLQMCYKLAVFLDVNMDDLARVCRWV